MNFTPDQVTGTYLEDDFLHNLRTLRPPHTITSTRIKEIKVKNKDYVWTSGGRAIRLEDMEDSHLINLICWLHRQQTTVEELHLELTHKGVQGATFLIWLERTRKELARRRSKEVREAYETLNKDIHCGVPPLQEADDE